MIGDLTAEKMDGLRREIERLSSENSNLQFIINRSAELLERGHRDEVEIYLKQASASGKR